jgi:hypothetical protein
MNERHLTLMTHARLRAASRRTERFLVLNFVVWTLLGFGAAVSLMK